jgi:CRP/FNR family cyclic AMP-dependent transcriptional regulator
LVRWEILLAGLPAKGKTDVAFAERETIFQQGSPADSLYFITGGKVQLMVTSRAGKEAIVATLGVAEFFGEGCLAGQPSRIKTAIASEPCTLIKVDKAAMARVLHDEPALSSVFVTHLLQRIVRYEADLVDQLFNSSEKRLARLLLLLSHFGKDSKSETVVAGVNQEHLAQMVGTTRSRINHFMNKFRKLGYIAYDAEIGLTVHRGLKKILQQDDAA